MQLVSMKLDPKSEEEAEMYPSMAMKPEDMPEYPYGLRLCLCEEQIKKLGLTQLPAAGTEMTITAKVKVAEVASRDTQGEGSERRIELQVTDLGMGQ